MINVAKIINTHALKGEVKVWLYTDSPDQRFVRGSRFELDDGQILEVESFRIQKGVGYVRFKGVNTIEKAEALKGHILQLDEKDLPAPEEGEYYYHQLLGCAVLNEKGEDLGKVSDILETGANLVLRVKNDKGQFLLPFVDAHIEEVEPENQIIRIREMAGLR